MNDAEGIMILRTEDEPGRLSPGFFFACFSGNYTLNAARKLPFRDKWMG